VGDSLLSVGIDVGTSTTQVIFSVLTIKNRGGAFGAPDFAITHKEVTYRGAVHTTPLRDAAHVDARALRALVESEYARAGVAVGGTDTGAVIITGESARKENARSLLTELSGFAGEFVVAAAGPDLESRIAGQGSGAQAASEAQHCRVANFDIGGGTTNIAVFDDGRLDAVGCYNIGGRQLRFLPGGQLIDCSESAQAIAQAAGLALAPGQTPSIEVLRRLAGAMASLLERAIMPGVSDPLAERVRTVGSAPLVLRRPVDAVSFSGGVADCVYHSGHAPFAFGDFGVLLGEAVRHSRLFGAHKVLTPAETIRATVIGAGSFTLTLSGSTIGYTNAGLFPLKNLPVFACGAAREEALFAGQPGDFAAKLRWFLDQNGCDNAALALAGRPNPGWQTLKQLAQALGLAANEALPPGQPLVLLLRHDMGKALCLALRLCLQGRPVIALDGVAAREDHYIDLGKPLMQGRVVPVVVKTLLFENGG
jgi:ethanolamine utilization protein EutA